ncbi:MAG: tetratricopeptide repeat protein [Candidatus Aureabacteria bacterium]|nr:tetratricopeptide repeat protein [Candidatus Auribacterota bacterium]
MNTRCPAVYCTRLRRRPRGPARHGMAWCVQCFLFASLATILLNCGPSPASEESPRSAAPSDIEQHVSRAIAFAYLHKPADLEREYLFFKGMDDFLKEKQQQPTGLSDRVLDLVVGSLTAGDTPAPAARGVPFDITDKKFADRAALQQNDDVAEANSLILTDRYNRFAFIFNTFVRPLSLITVGYFPALIDAGVGTILNAQKLTDLSIEEKKALALYKEFLERYPESDKAELLQHRATALDKKRIATYHNRELQSAEESLAQNDFWQAQEHFKNALAYMPESSRAASGLVKARELEQQRNQLRMKALEPSPRTEDTRAGPEERDYMNLLYCSAAGDPEEIIHDAEAFISRYPKSPYIPYALYAVAVAHDMQGEPEKAKKIMRGIASKYRRTHIGRRTAVYLSDPEYNLQMAFQSSQKDRAAKTTKYIALGPEFVKSNVMLGTSRIITQGLQSFQSLGTFNLMALLIRGVNSVTQNPVSDQEIIDTGITYLRRYPNSPVAPDVHIILAKAYAKRQNFSKAVYHFAASGKVSEKKLDSLREKAASQYLEFAKATENSEEKVRCYETILDEYPRTKAAAKAIGELALLEKSEKPIFEIDKKTLAENPIVFSLTALHIGPHLLDGDVENGELAPRGLHSRRHGKITLVYKEENGEREETFDIDYPTYRALKAFAEEVEYRKSIGDIKTAGAKVPVEFRGTVGDSGVFVYPRLKIREYQEKDLYLYK